MLRSAAAIALIFASPPVWAKKAASAACKLEKRQTAASQWTRDFTKISALYADGKYLDALALARINLDFAQICFGQSDARVGSSLNSLGAVLYEIGDFKESESAYYQALSVLKSALGPTHNRVMASSNNLAATLRSRGKFAEAKALYQSVISNLQDNTNSELQFRLAAAYNNLALVQMDQGLAEEALYSAGKAVLLFEALRGRKEPRYVNARMVQSYALAHLERYQEAEKIHADVIPLAITVLGESHADLSHYLSANGSVLTELDRLNEAQLAYTRAEAIIIAQFGADSPNLIDHWLRRSELEFKINGADKARAMLDRAFALSISTYGRDALQTSDVHLAYGKLFVIQSNFAEAEVHFLKAKAIAEAVYGEGAYATGDVYFLLAGLYEKMGRTKDAAMMKQKDLSTMP